MIDKEVSACLALLREAKSDTDYLIESMSQSLDVFWGIYTDTFPVELRNRGPCSPVGNTQPLPEYRILVDMGQLISEYATSATFRRNMAETNAESAMNEAHVLLLYCRNTLHVIRDAVTVRICIFD